MTMPDSRILLTCKHCGCQISIGVGALGSYVTHNPNLSIDLNRFYKAHSNGQCVGEYSTINDCTEYFCILEEEKKQL
jgi:hypothetical protein